MTKNISQVRRRENRANRPPSFSSDKTLHQQDASVSQAQSSQKVKESAQRSKEDTSIYPKLYTWSYNDRNWAPQASTVFKVLVSLRVSSAIWAPISDCDEVFNYWEPMHLLLYGSGLQTWEYAPNYGLRSYLYVWLFAGPARLFQLFLPHTKVTTFFFTRCLVGFVVACSELLLYVSVRDKLGAGAARYLALILAASAGMFVCSSSILPSTFSLICTSLSLGCTLLMSHQTAKWAKIYQFCAIMSIAASSLIGWPFAAILGLPVIGSMLFDKPRNVIAFAGFSVLAGVACIGSLLLVDSYYYGRWILAPFNIVAYNVLQPQRGGGPDLYGTEPISFYFVNLALNFNVVAILAPLAGPATFLALKHSSDRSLPGGVLGRASFVVYSQMALFLWLAIFFLQPHKEERFMFPIYPLLALGAALTLYAFEMLSNEFMNYLKGRYKISDKWRRVYQMFLVAILCIYSILCASRCMALYKNYHAPFDAYMALNERVSVRQSGRSRDVLLNPDLTVCVGKEWHRFPSSFFLPQPVKNQSGDGWPKSVNLKYVRSDFDGLLPKNYAPFNDENGDIRQATATVNGQDIFGVFNDRNVAVYDERYVNSVDECDYLIDFSVPDATKIEPDYSADVTNWQIVHRWHTAQEYSAQYEYTEDVSRSDTL